MAESRIPVALIVLALWAAGLGAAAQYGKISVMFAQLAAHYGGAGSVIGFMVSLVGLVGLVFGTTAGLFVQRLGYRRVIVVALAAGSGVSAFQAFLPGLGWMMASRVVEGISHLAIVVAGPVLIASVTPQRVQGLAMTLWSTFFGVSFALTVWLGLPLADRFGLWAVFAAHAAYLALLAAILAAILPRDGRDGSANATDPVRWGGILRQHGTIYASPFIAAPALSFLFYTLIYVAVLTLLPPLMPTADRVLVATGMPLISIAVSLGLGVPLQRVISAVGLVVVGLVVAAGFCVALGLLWGTPGAVVAAFGLAGGLGLVQGAAFSAIPQLNPQDAARAQASGAVAQMGNLGNTLGTPVLAALIGWYGVNGVLAFAVPLCGAGVLVTLWLSARRRNAPAMPQHS